MVVCCDTSFLFALYGNDVHSPRALQWVRGSSSALSITVLNEFELGNAMRFAEFRKAIPAGAASRYFGQFAADVSQGRIEVKNCNLARVMAAAKKLSEVHTLAGGHRSMDILHVASALELAGHSFLTFDANQKRLAEMAGLSVPI